MSKRVADWLVGIEKHYGSLAGFDDARTVRIMRQFALDVIVEHDRIIAQIKEPKALEHYHSTFDAEIERAKQQLEALDGWLAERGLTP